MKIKRLIYMILGFICLGAGAVGVILPVLPTVPFFLATVVCFGNSSERLHYWFVTTKMYQDHVEPFLQKKGMTIKTKVSIMISVTILMTIGFVLMGQVPMARAVLFVVWVAHIVYFSLCVKTRGKNLQQT